MTTKDFIIELFYRIDEELKNVEKHPQAKLYPSEVVTIAFLFCLKGVGNRAFYRWLEKDYLDLFPHLPERTRLFRLFLVHQNLTAEFLASPTLMGVIDAYGIELIHPIREGRSEKQIGKKGISNHRWIVGGKLCPLVNQDGLVVAWEAATANVHDTKFQPLIKEFEAEMIVLSDVAFHSREGDPKNLKICQRGTWNVRMIVETTFSMITLISHFKKMMHQVWNYFEMRLAYSMSMFNVLASWYGLQYDENGVLHLSIAEFSL
ncbi:MAG: transposase [Acidobacteriota bacterium]|nr:transposase [Acidobacteriota bacterium]